VQQCAVIEPVVRNSVLEHIMRELGVAVSCKEHVHGCDFSDTVIEASEHEKARTMS
jgi:hypothetical protein